MTSKSRMCAFLTLASVLSTLVVMFGAVPSASAASQLSANTATTIASSSAVSRGILCKPYASFRGVLGTRTPPVVPSPGRYYVVNGEPRLHNIRVRMMDNNPALRVRVVFLPRSGGTQYGAWKTIPRNYKLPVLVATSVLRGTHFKLQFTRVRVVNYPEVFEGRVSC
jgi:hypothetical protein